MSNLESHKCTAFNAAGKLKYHIFISLSLKSWMYNNVTRPILISIKTSLDKSE